MSIPGPCRSGHSNFLLFLDQRTQEDLFVRVAEALKENSGADKQLLVLATKIADHIFAEFDSLDGRMQMSDEFLRLSATIYEQNGVDRQTSMRRSLRLLTRRV
jgi:hypothetical protein